MKASKENILIWISIIIAFTIVYLLIDCWITPFINYVWWGIEY